MPYIILCLWGFLFIKDAGHRGNKITDRYHSNETSLADLLSSTFYFFRTI